jgi:hypothetical protein
MPDPVTPPAAPDGVAEHVERWLEEHLAPDLEILRADTAAALRFTAAHAQNLNAVAELVLKLVQTADPEASPATAALAAEAERLTAATALVAGELAGKM